jgi:UDP-N-acetylglucosamine:LPS N-acetylglucosamine transferase
LSAIVRDLLLDTQKLASMRQATRRLARPDAAERIAAIVREVAA